MQNIYIKIMVGLDAYQVIHKVYNGNNHNYQHGKNIPNILAAATMAISPKPFSPKSFV